jgi:thiol:disulfide interchange protein
MSHPLRFVCLLFVLVCVIGLPSGARARTAIPIHFTASADPTPAHAGEIVTVTVKATVDPEWHVYSVIPTPNGPATTEITAFGDWAAAGPTTEDTPIRKVDPNFNAVVGFHEGTATFSRQFHVPSGTASPPPSLSLHYQTCNDKICLPPTDVLVPVSAAITTGAVRAQYAKAMTPVATLTAAAALPVHGQGSSGSDGLALFLLAAVGGGLLAIVTPCVFPLIPITLTNFVKQAEGSQAKLVRLSFGYALGIVALYVALGAACAALLGGRANNIAANPWVNLVEFVLFVVFALSFFETIQITLPANLGALQQSARKHGGTAGLVLLGVTFVLGSFTCTAPFVGTLLVSAAGGHWFRPLLGMLVFALAFASPFFVFALFPQWIGRIPKGGVWLARFKATLGFIELAAALKFLSNADQVWQWKLLTQPVLLAAWAVVFFCAALYLWGTLRFGVVAETETLHQRVPLSRRLTATVFALIALYCFWGLAGKPIGILKTFLPPDGYGVAMAATNESLPWQGDYSQALAQAKAEGKPLLVDFTGYTCTNCRYNETQIFTHRPIQSQLANYVRVQLYTDGKDDAANAKLQETKFGDIALPLYGIVDPQTEAVVDKTEGVQTVGGFTQFLTKSAPAVNAPVPTTAIAPAALWSPYTPQAAATASQTGKPTIIDFTAKWCVNCHEIEHDVFEDPTVKPALGRDFVTLQADLTQWTSPASAALEKQYGFGSLPTIVFLDKTGKEIKPLRITGRLPVADFQKRMAAATEQ